ncbi:MAG: VWA domain-containing protein [Geminicoccaceae bacterium]|nr:VWA domain-containing protein [Geminicoccaceae bacterium]
MHFARALRAAGLPVGPGQVLDALRAVEAAGVESRETFYWTLHAVFVRRRDERVVFDQCFHVFWRDPKLLERLMGMLMPTLRPENPKEPEREVSRRVAEAMAPEPVPGQDGASEEEGEEVEVDMALTFSGREHLQAKDFEQMTADELREARAEIARMRLPIMEVKTRRFAPDDRGRRFDPRRTMRRSLQVGGHGIDLAKRRRRTRHPPLVILCDISGSMSRYSRLFLFFMHAITSDRDRVHAFVFGTRLTNVSRLLRHRDVDEALAKVGATVQDWSGGTRIGHCLETFNRDWSRRVLGQGAVVLLISDGLDRDAGEGLSSQMERLHKSCRRLVWLNPLLRFDGFEPISTGASVMIRHVDEFRSAHSLDSLKDLARVLSAPPGRRLEARSAWTA